MPEQADFHSDDDFGTPAFKPQGLDQILTAHYEVNPFVVDGLVRENSVSVFLVDPRVNVRLFAIDLAMTAASGTAIEPFGVGAGVPTMLYLPDGDADLDSKAVSALFARIGAPPARGRTRGNFRWCHGHAEGRTLPQLDKTDGQHAFMRSLPEGCKLVVLVNPKKYMAEPSDPMNNARLDALLAKLKKKGIAVAIFETAARPSSTASACVVGHHELIHLKLDAAAPVNFGEGFTITRPKPLCGRLPTTLHLWYMEGEGLIQSGWDSGLEDREAVGKQREIRERQESIARIYADYADRGLKPPTQKSIADALSVDPATVTRDMRDVRRRLKTQENMRKAAAPRPKDEA